MVMKTSLSVVPSIVSHIIIIGVYFLKNSNIFIKNKVVMIHQFNITNLAVYILKFTFKNFTYRNSRKYCNDITLVEKEISMVENVQQ